MVVYFIRDKTQRLCFSHNDWINRVIHLQMILCDKILSFMLNIPKSCERETVSFRHYCAKCVDTGKYVNWTLIGLFFTIVQSQTGFWTAFGLMTSGKL